MAFFVLVSCVNEAEKTNKNEDTKSQTTEIKKPAEKEIIEQEQAVVVEEDQEQEPDDPVIETITPKETQPVTEQAGFAVYKPKQSPGSNGWPLIIFLDPRGNGSLPVSLYKSLAEEYGFLLVASNKIVNGMPGREVIALFDELFNTAKTDFPVNQKRMYLMGFSGGARLSLAFAEAYPEIKGMISCGAGIQAGVKAPLPTFSYLSMGGNEDFNMIEIINTDRLLKRQGFERAMVIFDGSHNWPPAPVAKEAFQWIELNAMKDKSKALDNAAIQRSKQWYLQKINSLKDDKRIFDSYEVTERAIAVLDGLTDVGDLNVIAGDLKKDPAYLEQLSDMVKTLQMEMGLQNKYMQAFKNQDMEWWKAELKKLNDDEVSPSVLRMNKRLQAYLGIMAYMMSDKAVFEKDVDASAKYLEIYRLLEPTNPEHAYIEAKRKMMMNKQDEVLNYLQLAVILGFDDKNRLFNEPAFIPLHDDPKFIDLLK